MKLHLIQFAIILDATTSFTGSRVMGIGVPILFGVLMHSKGTSASIALPAHFARSTRQTASGSSSNNASKHQYCWLRSDVLVTAPPLSYSTYE